MWRSRKKIGRCCCCAHSHRRKMVWSQPWYTARSPWSIRRLWVSWGRTSSGRRSARVALLWRHLLFMRGKKDQGKEKNLRVDQRKSWSVTGATRLDTLRRIVPFGRRIMEEKRGIPLVQSLKMKSQMSSWWFWRSPQCAVYLRQLRKNSQSAEDPKGQWRSLRCSWDTDS